MADATSTLVIKARADVGDAVAGLNQVQAATVAVSNETGAFTLSLNQAVAGLITAELAMRVLEGSTNLAAASMQAAIASSDNLTKRSDVLTASIGELLTTMGQAALGGDAAAGSFQQLDMIIGALNDRLTVTVEDMDETGSAIGALNTALVGGLYVLNGFSMAWEGLETIIRASTGAMFAAGQATVAFGRAAVAVGGQYIATLVQGLADLIDTAIVASGTFGVELPESVVLASRNLQGLATELRNANDPLRELALGANAMTSTWAEFTRQVDVSGEELMEFLAANNTLIGALGRSMGSVEGLEEKTMPFTKTVDRATGAVQDLQEALDDLKATAMAFDLKAINEQAILDSLKESQISVTAALQDKAEADAQALRDWIVQQYDAVVAEYEARAALLAVVSQKIKESTTEDQRAPVLAKDYSAAAESLNALTVAGEGFGASFGQALQNGIGAALASAGSLEEFGRAFKAALGQSLVASGIQTTFEGLKALIPIKGFFNPAAAAVAIPLGFAMVGAGRAMGGGGGSAPSSGRGSSTGPGSSGITPAAPAMDRTPVRLIDYTGATIVTNDVDSMRTLNDRMTTTAAAGAGARI
jgi:hypothetical protein